MIWACDSTTLDCFLAESSSQASTEDSRKLLLWANHKFNPLVSVQIKQMKYDVSKVEKVVELLSLSSQYSTRKC